MAAVSTKSLEPARVKELLWPAEMRGGADVFAVLDGTRGRALREKLAVPGALPSRSLFQGEGVPASLAAAGPRLVRLEPDHPFTDYFLEATFGKALAIFVRSVAGLDALSADLRRFLVARDGHGIRRYFAFYDPRVLRVFLPICTKPERDEMFKVVASYLMEGVLGRSFVELALSPSGLVRRVNGGEPVPALSAVAGEARSHGARHAVLAGFTKAELLAEVRRRLGVSALAT